MERALISHLHLVAKQRPQGYLEACMKAGKISQDGCWITFSDAAHAALRDEFTLKELHPKPKPKFKLSPAHTIGLGDAFHQAAMPIARKLKLSCVKPNGTLRALSPCAMRRSKWNRIQLPTPAGLLASAKKLFHKRQLAP
jgi:hypothetical protein